ncbi:hypothetical protein ABPG77_001369 [Micractinium sp. CCAP 211/92]
MEPDAGSPVSRRTRSRTATGAEKRVAQPAAAPAVGVEAGAQGRACDGPNGRAAFKRAGSKRPREPALSEDDFSCPICLNLLVDPVVGSCGHDFCELCMRRWTVDQRKRSCPSCRKPLAGDLPGICLRLTRTIETLFPERLSERQTEVAEERRALAAEKRAREEAARREAAARRAAAPAHGFGGDLLMHAVLEQLLQEPIFRQAAPGGAAEQQRQQRQPRQQPAAQQQQQGQEQQAAAAARVQPGSWPPTQRQQEGRLVQRRYPVRAAAAAAAAAGPEPPAAQQQAQGARRGVGGPQPRMEQELPVPGGMGQLLQTLLQAGQRAEAEVSEQLHAQAQQAQQAQQEPHVLHRQHFHVQVIHLQSGPPPAGSRQAADALPDGASAGMPLRFGMQAAARPAGGEAAASAAGGRGSSPAAAAWPMGPPLDEMEFNMGWHDAGEAHRRSRRQPRSRR